MEALGANKPLLVVVNDKLMDNHQLELAKQLEADSQLIYCTCRFALWAFTFSTVLVLKFIVMDKLMC